MSRKFGKRRTQIEGQFAPRTIDMLRSHAMRPLSRSARRLLAVTHGPAATCRQSSDACLGSRRLVARFGANGEAAIAEPNMTTVSVVASENTIASATAVQPACLTDALAVIDRAGTDQVVAHQRESGKGRGP